MGEPDELADLGIRRFPRRRRRRRIVVVPPVPAAMSLSRARDRHQRITRQDGAISIWRERFDMERSDSEDNRRTQRPTAEFEYPGWSASEYVRRQSQIGSASTLLAARITDTVLNGLEQEFGGDIERASQTAAVDLGYQCIVRHTGAAGTIGSLVEIECRHPEFVAALLSSVPSNWLGIETVVVYGEPPEPFAGHGQIGGYLTGFTGLGQMHGPLTDNGRAVGMTCHHVDRFPPLVDFYRTSPDALETPSPDAQIVQVQDVPGKAAMVYVAFEDAARLIMHHRLRLVRSPRACRYGQVFDIVEAFPLLGKVNRFPSLRIRARQSRLFGVVNWPLSAAFSKPGDSGSWVIDPASMTWIGMVVAGRCDIGDTYAHRAEALYGVISRELIPWRDPWCELRSIVERLEWSSSRGRA